MAPDPQSLPGVPDESTLDGLIAGLDASQLCRLTCGQDMWSLPAEPAIGLRSLVLSDGPVGVRGVRWDDRTESACTPSPTALAATWDEQLVEQVGVLAASEARRQGVDVVLAPTVNLHRTPVGGRHFECYSEDPVLTGRIAQAWVHGIQSHGVGACVKHFVGNDAETERTTVDNLIDEQTLNELYLAPFEHLEKSTQPWSWMNSYNGVNGTQMSWSPLLNEVLKGRWGAQGAVVTDWGANRETVPSARAGVDISMPAAGNPWENGRLAAAVASGQVELDAIRAKVRSILRLAARCGALDGFEPAPQLPTPQMQPEQVADLLREVAAKAMVLVRNDGTLPLESPTKVALIGPNAVRGRHSGGGSATVFPRTVKQPWPSLQAALPEAEVVLCEGTRPSTRVPHAEADQLLLPDGSGPGVLVSFIGGHGEVLDSEVRPSGSFNWIEGFAGLAKEDVHHLRWQTRFTATSDGVHRLGASGMGEFSVRVDGALAASGLLQPLGDRPAPEYYAVPPQLLTDLPMTAGQSVLVDIDYLPRTDLTENIPVLNAYLNIGLPWAGDEQELQRAATLAADSEVAIVVVGTNDEVESEGFDRTDLRLPGNQDELVRRVVAANPRTVVVVNSGSPVLMPWLDEVAAVLLVWFPGQEMGDALAEVLLGRVEPAGRMPTSWPAEGAVVQPENVPTEGTLVYTEGLNIGYREYDRRGIAPAVPFGFGLGWTTWSLESTKLLAPDVTPDSTLTPTPDLAGQVRVQVSNTGQRDGAQVVQVYLRRADTAVQRPTLWLAGFTRVEVPAQGSVPVLVGIPRRAVQHWAGDWVVEPGSFEVLVGFHSAELTTVGELTLP